MIGNLNITDSFIILLYLFIVLLIVLFQIGDREQTSKDYFLAGRSLGWFAVGISLFATNISSEHIVGLAGSGASRGLAVGQFEWMAIFILLILGWLFSPVLLKMKLFTLPEFFEKRFDRRSRKYLTYVSIVAYILTKISVTLFAGGLLLREVFGWDLFTSTVVMVLLTGLYTVVGGMPTVVNTQIFQTFVIIIGAFLLTFVGLTKVGGISGLTEKLPADFFVLFKPASDPDFPWTGIIFGAPIIAIWYWCTDQYIIQRILSAKGVEAARRGTILAAFLKILPVFIFVLPGLIALALFPEIKGDEAYPFLVTSGILPTGIKGLVVASLIAALMSSLASVFHSTATLYTLDIYKPKHPEASDRKLVLVGRLAVTVTVISAILWMPLIKNLSANMYIYMQSVQSYIAPPIAAVFLLGFFWKGANENGAFWALILGGIIGLIRLVAQFMIMHDVQLVWIIEEFARVNYLHFAILLFIFSSATVVVGSKFSFSASYSENRILSNLSPFYIYSQNGYSLRSLKLNKGEVALYAIIIISAISFWSLLN